MQNYRISLYIGIKPGYVLDFLKNLHPNNLCNFYMNHVLSSYLLIKNT